MKRFFTAVLCACMLFLTGCNTVFDWNFIERTVAKCGSEVLSEKEFRVISLEYKGLFEMYYKDLLSESFWEAKLKDGNTFEEYVKQEYILHEIEALLELNLLAKEEELTITREEEKELFLRAHTYFGELSDDEKAFIGASEQDVYRLLKRFHLAYKAESLLLSDITVEISDEESRVCDLEVIHTETEAAALELKKRIDNGENFRNVANENTIDPKINFSVSRSLLVEPFKTVIFDLSEGEVSEVINFGGEGFIFRLANSYNMLLSQNNKHNLLAKLRFEKWKDVYLNYGFTDTMKVNHAFVKRLSLRETGEFPYVSLFSE